ncbi:hypothetical protein JOC86_002355 [Bacillus pakistanensis]|uniref:Uncharacterized protein n=1 Tax=Rossellomorea pakistanensis TaxID=992288 RepID=A0ABS2ND72_9BACI|nr:hypothetical protein [Bacillus pakistanensis]MBM7585813.1 hypothetical protein [Bacillus pakistanensis]
MINNNVPYRVLLPKRLWSEARDKEHLKRLVLEYMQRYPNYVVKGVKNGMAICEREEIKQ